MAFSFAPPPIREKFDGEDGTTRRPWVDWLTSLTQQVVAAPERIATTSATGQSVSIPATDLSDGTAGLYRITYYARITTAAVTTSSLTVTFSWTDGGVVCSLSGAAMTANTTTTVQTGTALVRSDASAPITYATTYASNGAGEMKYQLDVTVEGVVR